MTCSTGRNTCRNKFASFETNMHSFLRPVWRSTHIVENILCSVSDCRPIRRPSMRRYHLPHVFNIVSKCDGTRKRRDEGNMSKPTYQPTDWHAGTHAHTHTHAYGSNRYGAETMCTVSPYGVSFAFGFSGVSFVILLRDYVRHKPWNHIPPDAMCPE